MDPTAWHNGDDEPCSPTDTQQPAGYEPIITLDDGLSESFQSTDTVRHRPEPSLRPDGSSNYNASNVQATPGSATTASQIEGSSTATDRIPLRSSQSFARFPGLGTGRSRPRPRKPPMTRRTSSNAQAPHRGEIFSVDDDANEVEADAAAERQQTLRRRTLAPPSLSRVHSALGDEVVDERPEVSNPQPEEHVEDVEAETPADVAAEGEVTIEEAGEGDISDAESFTLKDRQQAINQTHPFGIRLWKPALYRKDRSVQKTAERDIHSSPGGHVSSWLLFFNIIWTLAFGWWMASIAFVGALVCFASAAAPSGREYGRVLWGLARYLFYPFGKFVRLEQQDAYLDEDQGEGRSISEYEQWQSGDLEYGRLFFGPQRARSIVGHSRRSLDSDVDEDETESLLGRGRGRGASASPVIPRIKRRLFGRGEWNIGRVIFFLFFYFLLTPSLFIVSAICWFLVFWIPMGKVTMLLFDHLRRHPLALAFESDISPAREPTAPHSSIIVCTYRAVGLKYWKYTIDGTNIFLINLMSIVGFVILDWLVLKEVLHMDIFITSSAFLFIGGLASIIPLAYFIGQAVASISAQSSMGLGAAINAFFSTLVEVFLYCVALQQGKGQLVEGSIIGSIFAGILFLPGLSMCFGAIKRKTQRFNSKSAGVTSTMLLFAVIGAFGPTLFYQIYGTHELTCSECLNLGHPEHGATRECRRCYFSQAPAINDRFYLQAVRPYCYLAAGMLFLSYVIGLWFTLRTHAAVIWNTELEEKRHEEQLQQMVQHAGRSGTHSIGDASGADIRDSHLYKRILGQSLRHVGLQPRLEEEVTAYQQTATPNNGSVTSHIPSTKGMDYGTHTAVHIPGFTEAENNELVHQVAEIAATAATVAARDVRNRTSAHGTSVSSQPQPGQQPSALSTTRPTPLRTTAFLDHEDMGDASTTAAQTAGGTNGGHGHDAPNWSRLKSSIILMGATVLYAIIAEILVNTVDVVLEGFAIDEKFLGITLFALVPNTTEFLNAISFAMNGNIALSMEIGSAYALQVCLLQIPALVLFSAVFPLSHIPAADVARYTFSLLFPQWDMVTVILCVFLLSYMYGEGKSNYFKGSILLLSYLVVIVGYYFSAAATSIDGVMGPHISGDGSRSISRFDTLGDNGQWMSYGFKTVGRGTAGMAF